MRLKVLRVIIIFLFGLIAAHLFYIQILRGRYYYDLSRNNRIRVVALEGRRGKILDRNGVILADNRVAFNVMVVPQEIEDRDELLAFLEKALGISKEKLLKTYRQRAFGSFAPIAIAEDITRDQAIVLEENRFRFPGLVVQESFRRIYPLKESAAHVIGYIGKIDEEKVETLKHYGYTAQSVIGKSGVEEFYDHFLRGEEGGLQVEVNSRGEQVRLLGLREPAQGADINLTIDYRIQQMAMNALAGRPGAVVIMDLTSGEILALISSPSYDPNVFVRNLVSETGTLFSNPLSPLLNRAVSGQYPPGSVFKIPVALCALTQNKITPETQFECKGFLELGNRQFRCTHTHGIQNLIEAIAHSCNVYFYHVGLLVGVDAINQFAQRLQLGRPTGIDLPYEAAGFIPSRQYRQVKRKQSWYTGDTLNLAIGQGDVLATPLQLADMMAVLVNDGQLVHPHVIKSIGTQVLHDYDPSGAVHFVDTVLKILDEGLRQTVVDPSGTANILNIPGITVAGKTGTAQTTANRETHAWFAGYGVSPKNKIAFCVFLEHGGSSVNACSVAKELLLRMQQEKIL